MSDSFAILSGFLERFSDDVEGRSVEEAPDEVKRQLAAMASGSLSETERDEMITLLQANPQWVPLLARAVKALRPDARIQS